MGVQRSHIQLFMQRWGRGYTVDHVRLAMYMYISCACLSGLHGGWFPCCLHVVFALYIVPRNGGVYLDL